MLDILPTPYQMDFIMTSLDLSVLVISSFAVGGLFTFVLLNLLLRKN